MMFRRQIFLICIANNVRSIESANLKPRQQMGNSSSLCQTGRKASVGGRQSGNMEGKAFLTEEAAYKSLQDYYKKNGSKLVINQLFKEDPDRFKKYR